MELVFWFFWQNQASRNNIKLSYKTDSLGNKVRFFVPDCQLLFVYMATKCYNCHHLNIYFSGGIWLRYIISLTCYHIVSSHMKFIAFFSTDMLFFSNFMLWDTMSTHLHVVCPGHWWIIKQNMILIIYICFDIIKLNQKYLSNLINNMKQNFQKKIQSIND